MAAIFENLASLAIWTTEIRPKIRMHLRKARMALVSQGCPDPANDLLVKLIALEIEAMNELVETATEFEACYAQVGGKGGALGKNGLIKNFLVRLKVVVDYIDRDRTIGKRTIRRSCAVLAIRLGLIRLNEVIRFEVHGFDALASLGASRALFRSRRTIRFREGSCEI